MIHKVKHIIRNPRGNELHTPINPKFIQKWSIDLSHEELLHYLRPVEFKLPNYPEDHIIRGLMESGYQGDNYFPRWVMRGKDLTVTFIQYRTL